MKQMVCRKLLWLIHVIQVQAIASDKIPYGISVIVYNNIQKVF